MKRLDISVSGTAPEAKRRLFRFESDFVYREIYQWFLRNGTKYLDGRCGGKFSDGSPEVTACKQNQWTVAEIQNGTEPEFFGVMEQERYPPVSRIFDRFHDHMT